MNKLVAVTTGALFLAGSMFMGACGKSDTTTDTVQYDIECDAGDYAEHDSDCGYSPNGEWTYYYWTAPGKTTYAPEGWVPPEEVKNSYKIKVKAPGPTKTKSTPKQNSTKGSTNKTSVIQPKPNKPVADKPVVKTGRK